MRKLTWILALAMILFPLAREARAEVDRSRALVFSGIGCFGLGLTGVVLGKNYKADADASYSDYLHNEVSSEEELETLRTQTEDLDSKSSVWYGVGIGGIVVGSGLVLVSAFVGKDDISRGDPPRYSLDITTAPRGGEVRLAMRF